jgi:hypothetical protein
LTVHSMQTLFRCLRTWPRIMAKGIFCPPIIHHTMLSQPLMPAALAKCYTLTRMWDGHSPGSDVMVQEIITKEMQSLLDTVRLYISFSFTSLVQANINMSVSNPNRYRSRGSPTSTGHLHNPFAFPRQISKLRLLAP